MIRAVEDVLEEIGAGADQGTERILVLNKIDALDAEARLELAHRHRDVVMVSALTGEGLDELADRVEEAFKATMRPMELLLPYADGAQLAELHDVAGEMERDRHARGRARQRAGARRRRPPLRALPDHRRPPGVTLRVRRLDPAARLPGHANDGDAGYDLHALEPVALAPGERALVRTGIAVEIPAGHAGLVLPRSGNAVRHGIALVNAPGLIDSGYRGELQVLLLNTDRSEPFAVAAGDRIAQLVLVRVETPAVEEVATLTATQRGEGGFGSSGR